ncbi:MAG TPA: Swt1 family HEPN domain-containing protein [Ktedonobacteraceae bacterium]|jgi:tetratricopeptide (TPR) repeat protein
MAQNNGERVGQELDRLRKKLRPFVERQMRNQYGTSWQQEIRKILSDIYPLRRDFHLDVQALLRIMQKRWDTVFHRVLGPKAERIIRELLGARNKWAHQETFSDTEVKEILHNIEFLVTRVAEYECYRPTFSQASTSSSKDRSGLEYFEKVGKQGRESELAQSQQKAKPDVPTQQESRHWTEIVAEYLKDKQYKDTIVVCDQAIQLDQNNSYAYLNKGWALNELGRYDEALRACDQALRCNPRNASAHICASEALIHLKRYSEALEACNRALQHNPSNVLAHIRAGEILIHLKGYPEALEACKRALRIDPHNIVAHSLLNKLTPTSLPQSSQMTTENRYQANDENLPGKFCPTCGVLLRANWFYCRYCGRKTPQR